MDVAPVLSLRSHVGFVCVENQFLISFLQVQFKHVKDLVLQASSHPKTVPPIIATPCMLACVTEFSSV